MALTEIAGEWASAVARWKVLNAPHLVIEGEMRAPVRDVRIHAVSGAARRVAAERRRRQRSLERMQAYALKAAREGKQETSWLNPARRLTKRACTTFVARILDRAMSAEFLDSLRRWRGALSLLGALNSLSQITLKATMPGVPDFYQGTEFWDLSLVDPDNRRPVDFAARAKALASLEAPDWDHLVQNWSDGHLKLAWTRHLLKLRSELADVFTDGDYRAAGGYRPAPQPCHCVCAAARRRRRDCGGNETLGDYRKRAVSGRARMSLTALSISQAIRWRDMPANCRSRSCSPICRSRC